MRIRSVVSRLALAVAVLAPAVVAHPAAAQPRQSLDLAALNQRNELVLFSDKRPGAVRVLPVTGVAGKLLGIDVRPKTGDLYGLATDGGLYVIGLSDGVARKVATLSVPLEAVDRVVVDFNPQADRLRVIASNGQNLRVNVETGQAAVDKPLSYAPKDRNAGTAPRVTAGAYINSFAGATSTQLFDLDSGLGTYVVQDPPNDGVLRTVGPTGLKAGTVVTGFDIYTDAADEYVGRAVVGGTLYGVDVARGGFKPIGPIGGGKLDLIDLAVLTKR